MENKKQDMQSLDDCVIMAFEKNNGHQSLEIVASKPVNTKQIMQKVSEAVKKYSPEYDLQKRNGGYVYLNNKGDEVSLYPLNAKEEMSDKYLIIANQELSLFIKNHINAQNNCKEVYVK